MVTAHLDMITRDVGILRGGENFKYGEPYDFVATILKLNHKAYIMGYKGEYTKAIRSAIQETLTDSNITEVYYVRQTPTGEKSYAIKAR